MLLEITQLVHVIGIALGVGGATIHFLLSLKAEKDPEIRPAMMKISVMISKLIIVAVVLLIASGLGLKYQVRWPIDPTMLAIKHTVVGLLVINGAYLNLAVFRRLQKAHELTEGELAKLQKRGKIAGLISLILWYSILVLSVFL